MSQKLSPVTALLLTVPPLMWAGNAVVGRLVTDLVPPITLNFLRWFVALFILLPLAWKVLRPGSGLWSHWRRFGLLSLLGVGCYNALQYLALQTSTPLNVTLVAASGPFWMLVIGALFFKAPVRRMQLVGAMLSISGVLVVLSRGQWAELMAVRLVAGDMYVLLATACWSFYSWLLTRRDEPEAIRGDWAAFLLGQVVFGLGWSGLFAGLEWTFTDAHIVWGWPLWPSARPCWPTAAGAWASSKRAQQWRVSLPTSRRCLRRCCRPRFWASCRTCTTWRRLG
jgi:drug/metabolite transporter (DMT)-like permease